jgi:ABC-2 type transport system permease protein
MTSFRNSLAIAWKDLQLIFKDRGALIVLFGLPLLIGSMYGSIYNSMDITGEQGFTITISLVNLDDGPYGEQIVSTLEEIDLLEIQPAETIHQAEALVSDETVMAAIVIPASLSQNVSSYESSTLEVIVDPAQAQFGNILTGILKEVVTPIDFQGELTYGIRTVLDESGLLQGAPEEYRQAVEAQITGVLMTQVMEMFQNPLISLRAEDLLGGDVLVPSNWFAVFIPAFVVMFAFFIVPGLAPELLKEKREGTLRRLLAAPLARRTILSGKMLAYLVIVFLQVLLLFGVGSMLFEMPLGDDPLGVVLVSLALGLSATSLGVMVAALARSERQADAVGMVLGFLLAGIGGCIQIGLIPTYRMEGFLGSLSRFVPHSYALESYRILMIESGTLTGVLPNILILLGFALVFFAIGVWKFKYD